MLVVEELQKKYLNLFIANTLINHGKGHAVALGMSVATGELRLFVDADNSVSIENLDRFILEIEKGSDIVIASIYKKGAVVTGVRNQFRSRLSLFFAKTINYIFAWDILDTQRGFKLFTKKSAEIVFKKLKTKRYLFDLEVLLKAQKNGLKIKELAVVWENKRGSKVRPIDFLRSFWEFLIIYWRS
jgi:dolichyl-phosphate beta-glucosyltransferase